MVNITKIEHLHISNFKFSNVKQNTNGGKTIFVNKSTDDYGKITIVTPKCYLPFGVSTYNGRKSIQLSLNEDTCGEFKEFLSQLDLRVLQEAVNSSHAWFNKTLSPEAINDLYNPCLKQKTEKYPPNFRARFPTHPDTNRFLGDIFDTNRNVVSESAITPGCSVEAIVELTGVYFVAKEFGLSWKIIQLKVFPNNKLQGYSFVSDSDDDSDAEPC